MALSRWAGPGGLADDAALAGGVHGARVVRVGAAGDGDGHLRYLCGTVRRHDDGRTGVVFHEVAAAELPGGVAAAVAASLELPAGLNRLELLGRTAERLADRPAVFLLPPPPEPRPQLGDEAAQWLDRLEKTDPRKQCILLILLDTPENRVVGEVFDPVPGPASGAGAAEPDRACPTTRSGAATCMAAWPGKRAATLPGRRRRATTPWPTSPSATRPPSRRAHESLSLKRPSPTWAPALSTSASRNTSSTACAQTARSASWLVAQRTTSLEAVRLLWRPPGTDTAMPVPWLARGLLLAGLVPLAAHHLRACLVLVVRWPTNCSTSLLRRSRRAGAGGRPGLANRVGNHPDVAINRHQSFLEPGSYAAALYPPGCPALPDDPWPFATFGEFLSVMAPGDPRREI